MTTEKSKLEDKKITEALSDALLKLDEREKDLGNERSLTRTVIEANMVELGEDEL